MDINLFLFIVVLVLLVGIDPRDIGLSLLLFGYPPVRGVRKNIFFTIYVDSIRSNCFTENKEITAITTRLTDIDAKIGITKKELLIGLRLLCYRYKVPVESFVKIETTMNRLSQKIVIHACMSKDDESCIVEIKSVTLSHKKYEKMVALVNALKIVRPDLL